MQFVRIVPLLSLLLFACETEPTAGHFPQFVYACPVPADDVACAQNDVTKFAAGADIAFDYEMNDGRHAEVRRASDVVDDGELAFIAFDGDRVVDFFHVTIAKVTRLDVDTTSARALVVTPRDAAGDPLGGRLVYSVTTESDAVALEVDGRTIRVRALRSATVDITVSGGGVEETISLEVKA